MVSFFTITLWINVSFLCGYSDLNSCYEGIIQIHNILLQLELFVMIIHKEYIKINKKTEYPCNPSK